MAAAALKARAMTLNGLKAGGNHRKRRGIVAKA